MRRLLVLFFVLSRTVTHSSAFAWGDECCVDCAPKLMNAQMALELRSFPMKGDPACTTYVGFNPAYAGSNYWSIGVGHRRPRGTFGPFPEDIPPVPDEDTGYWDFDHLVNDDTLQGWWSVRHRLECTGGCEIPDTQRPGWAIDIGNQVNHVLNQGTQYRRALGVVGVWHSDPGSVVLGSTPGTNPVAPAWGPLGGTRSAWCGLRAHGDLTAIDPQTGNPFNVSAMEHTRQNAHSAGGTDRKYPGYASQWDQMLYRDVDISGHPGVPITLRFKVRTRMSTGYVNDPGKRAGWFELDPLSMSPGNYVPAAPPPIDRLSVHVGKPVEPNPGDDYTGSDELGHEIFDPMRRWFSEVLDIGAYATLMSLTGDNTIVAPPAAIVIPAATLATMGPKVRFVFRVKTNREYDDDTGSLCGYSSDGMGAAQVDDVTIAFGVGAPISLGDFESPSDIDNSLAVSALSKWKSTGKPPGLQAHPHALGDLLWQDLCGIPGSKTLLCNLAGNVISDGDHEDYEDALGPLGTAEQDRIDAVFSPTINLVTPNDGSPNAMGIRSSTFANFEDFQIAYGILARIYDQSATGISWQFFFQSYPAVQSDGVRGWGEFRVPDFLYFDTDPQCMELSDPAGMWGLIRTSNPSGIPDSIRIGLRKVAEPYRFAMSAVDKISSAGYWDNISLAIVGCDPNPCGPVSTDIWHWIQDTFPEDETVDPPAFFSLPAKIETGLNTAAGTCDPDVPRCDDPGDYSIVTAEGPNTRVDMVFRILPGPGNYVVPGDRSSGLRAVPGVPVAIAPGDGSFWSEYIADNGDHGTPDGHPSGAFATRWSELIWNSARLDTAECFCGLFPLQRQGVGCGPRLGKYSATYHEDDPKLETLALAKHRCFLVDTLNANDYCHTVPANVTCTSVPAWVTAGGLPYKTGYDGNAFTRECSKIIPDGLLTPGSHVEYFFRRGETDSRCFVTVPDTALVFPQWAEGPSTDAHRWQQFSVLPDAWKEASFGGLGRACMLYVDWTDRRGNERIWDGIADSIGATLPPKRGAHNGWQAPTSVNPNDPTWFTYQNAQPGTTWDMYGVKAAESLAAGSGSLGARLAFRPPGPPPPCEARNAPTPYMLKRFYATMLIHTGDISSVMLGPFLDRSQNDVFILDDFLTTATESGHRGLWVQGEGFVESAANNTLEALTFLINVLKTDHVYRAYSELAVNHAECIDLDMAATNDIYGIRNSCAYWNNVLKVANGTSGGVEAAYYPPVGLYAPYVASVFKDEGPGSWYQSQVDGWDVENLLSRGCDVPYGRLAYSWKFLTNVFAKICAITGAGFQTVEVSHNADGTLFANLAGLGNNPLRHGSALIKLTLSQADRVTVRIHDVSGRLVRTLANGQLFPAGRVDPELTWDGLDDRGRSVPRGVYFVNVRYQDSRYEASPRMIVLR